MRPIHSQCLQPIEGLDAAYGHSIHSSRPKLLCRFRHPVTADNRSCFQDHSVDDHSLDTCTVSTTIDPFSRCCRDTDLIRAVQHLFRYESCGDSWATIVRLTMRPLPILLSLFIRTPRPGLFRAFSRATLRVKARLPRNKMSA